MTLPGHIAIAYALKPAVPSVRLWSRDFRARPNFLDNLSGNFLGEGRQFNMASYRANLDLDMDLGQTLAVQRGSIKEAVQV